MPRMAKWAAHDLSCECKVDWSFNFAGVLGCTLTFRSHLGHFRASCTGTGCMYHLWIACINISMYTYILRNQDRSCLSSCNSTICMYDSDENSKLKSDSALSGQPRLLDNTSLLSCWCCSTPLVATLIISDFLRYDGYCLLFSNICSSE